MKFQLIRSVVLVVVSAALGAAFYAHFNSGTVLAQSDSFKFIKADQFAPTRTVAVNSSSSRLVFITSQVGMSAEKKMPDDIGEQADLALANLERELAAAGLKRTDVAKLTIYVQDLDLVEGGLVLRSVQTFFGGSNTPVITWVGVTALMLPNAYVEIEAMAVAGN